MIHETISLPVQYRNKGVDNNMFTPTLTTYILDNYDEFSALRKRPAVIICPGGGYARLSNRETEAIAIKMNTLGFHALVLRYSVAPMDFPAALLDAAEAMYYTRSHCKEWNIDENKIILCGFSAGGHLAASLGVYWNSSLITTYLPYKTEEIKPNGLLLCYPVITAGEYAHKDSIKNVLGKSSYTSQDVSLELHITKDVPPVFMWHTDEDVTVPAENSLFFVQQLRQVGVPVEYHLFRKGRHGIALATEETSTPDGYAVEKSCAIWPQLFSVWMETL